MRDEWFDFLPIFIIFFFVCYPYEFVQLSETSLGKFFAVFIIIYYSSVDLVYGILACAVIVLYYHIEVSTSIWSIERSRQIHESMMNLMDEMDNTHKCGGKCGGKCGDKCGGKCGDKCGDKCGCQHRDSMIHVESFQSGSPDIFRYEAFDLSRGRNFNESILSGTSPKKELEQAMKPANANTDTMYPSVESRQQFAAVDNNNPIGLLSSERKGIVDRIFETVHI